MPAWIAMLIRRSTDVKPTFNRLNFLIFHTLHLG